LSANDPDAIRRRLNAMKELIRSMTDEKAVIAIRQIIAELEQRLRDLGSAP